MDEINGIPIPKSKFRFAEFKKTKRITPKDVRVFFGGCKHSMVLKSPGPHDAMGIWMAGAERPDAEGVYHAREIYGKCPNCRIGG